MHCFLLTMLKGRPIVIHISKGDGHCCCSTVAPSASKHVLHLNYNKVLLTCFSVNVWPGRHYNALKWDRRILSYFKLNVKFYNLQYFGAVQTIVIWTIQLGTRIYSMCYLRDYYIFAETTCLWLHWEIGLSLYNRIYEFGIISKHRVICIYSCHLNHCSP